MIASLRGTVASRRPDHVVVECAGVGYRAAVSAETLRQVPAAGEEVLLHTELVARDESMQL
jgi:holliday junction DNA helicase RuvA